MPLFKIFTLLADLIVYRLIGLDPATRLAGSLHFFIEDVTKILVMVVVMIYLIALLRAGLNAERVRDFLKKRSRAFGYVAGALFGAVTPFCSCSSIPLFLGFTSARIPLGITMSFLITSPMINEAAVILLGGLLGWKFTLVYIGTGLAAGIIGGIFLDLIGAEKHLTGLADQARNIIPVVPGNVEKIRLTLKERHIFAVTEVKTIFGRIWKWVLIGVGAGAALHGFVPQEFIARHLGAGQWWTVPAAVLLGIPLYANATGMIPVVESLLAKGLPVGTALALMMSTVAASLPEFIMLKQVMKIKLLVIFFFMLLVFFTLAGWIYNIVL
jgi:uncharacterized membrane protein YraQ (UPF0718 family)